MDQATKDNLVDRNIWSRGLYMLFFMLAYTVAETLLGLLVVFQFIAALVTRKVNDPLHKFAANLSAYIYQILQFETFNSELRPFPFSDWPERPTGATPWSGVASTSPAQSAERAPADKSAHVRDTATDAGHAPPDLDDVPPPSQG